MVLLQSLGYLWQNVQRLNRWITFNCIVTTLLTWYPGTKDSDEPRTSRIEPSEYWACRLFNFRQAACLLHASSCIVSFYRSSLDFCLCDFKRASKDECFKLPWDFVVVYHLSLWIQMHQYGLYQPPSISPDRLFRFCQFLPSKPHQHRASSNVESLATWK